MKILDQFGRPMSTIVHAAQYRANGLPFQRSYIEGIDELIRPGDWAKTVSASREMFTNFGPLRGAIEQKAMWCVGNAWSPQFTGSDRAWGQDAAEWLNGWFKILDIRGFPYDFQTLLYLASVSIDRDGDIGMLMTTNSAGDPRIQVIPAHLFRSGPDDGGTVEHGRYKGRTIRNGVIVDSNNRPMAYRVVPDAMKPDEFKDIKASALIFPFDPSWADQTRGIPLAVHALGDFRASNQSKSWEMWAQLIASSVALIESNESGGPEADDPTVAYGSAPSDGSSPGIGQKLMDGGMIRYFESGSGGKIESLRTERPSPEWDAFQDRIIRSGCAGIGWPYELVWKNDGTAAAQRNVLAQADKAIVDRQVLLEAVALKMTRYGLALAIQSGQLPPNDEFWRWQFTKPRKITIDAGREGALRLSEFQEGIKTLTDIAEEEGTTLDALLRKRAYEIARAEQIRAEVEAETGTQIDPDKMPLLDRQENQTND